MQMMHSLRATHSRHAPRRRGIQYAVLTRFDRNRRGVLDRPPSRTMTERVARERLTTVIASAAKQPIVRHHGEMDCVVAPLLAMTATTINVPGGQSGTTP